MRLATSKTSFARWAPIRLCWFLDGVQNTRFQPNENFARELFELFTLGVDNGYTQADIVNAARALSGWNGITLATLCGEIGFVPSFWDNGQNHLWQNR